RIRKARCAWTMLAAFAQETTAATASDRLTLIGESLQVLHGHTSSPRDGLNGRGEMTARARGGATMNYAISCGGPRGATAAEWTLAGATSVAARRKGPGDCGVTARKEIERPSGVGDSNPATDRSTDASSGIATHRVSGKLDANSRSSACWKCPRPSFN